MRKTLRVGFAMGGGVSMGTFSGVALGEALKLLLLYGGRQGDRTSRYEKVIVDVLSGASAGAMSLLLMLRSLARPEPKFLAELQSEDRLTAWLREVGASPRAIKEKKTEWDQLLAAQYVQDIQKKVWMEEINIERLCGVEGEQFSTATSIFNRDALEAICAKYLDFGDTISFGENGILSERVLFACSLSNLSPITHDARYMSGMANNIFKDALTDGMTSPVHKDMRVFDLRFKKPNDDEIADERLSPKRWWRYYADAGQRTATAPFGELKNLSAWTRLAATAIACGCFPFAFEPVVLPRKKHEYPEKVWEAMFANYETRFSSKPFDLDKEFPFTYVDGGVFNNEPIREAYRLATFMDSQHICSGSPDDEHDRVIIFVDPITGSDRISYNLAFHADMSFRDPRWYELDNAKKLRERSSLSKLAALAPAVLTALADEGRVVEADKIDATQSKFDSRDKLRARIIMLPYEAMGHDLDDVNADLWAFCQESLEGKFKNDLIPVGSLTVISELIRVLTEEKNALASVQQTLMHCFRQHAAEREKLAYTTLSGCLNKAQTNGAPSLQAGLARLLFCVALDLLLDLQGKPQGQSLLAIAPWDIDVKTNKSLRQIDLPGAELSAFAGFMSKKANTLSETAAVHCTRKYLYASGYLAPAHGVQKFIDLVSAMFTVECDIAAVRKEIRTRGQLFIDRVSSLITSSYLMESTVILQGKLRSFASRQAAIPLERWLENIPPSKKLQLRIYVPEEGGFHLDRENFLGGRLDDLNPVPDPAMGKPFLPLELSFTPAKYGQPVKWSGQFLTKDQPQRICLSKQGTFGSTDVTPIPLPNEELVRQTEFYPGFFLSYDLGAENETRDSDKWKIVPAGYSALETTLGALLSMKETGGSSNKTAENG